MSELRLIGQLTLGDAMAAVDGVIGLWNDECEFILFSSLILSGIALANSP